VEKFAGSAVKRYIAKFFGLWKYFKFLCDIEPRPALREPSYTKVKKFKFQVALLYRMPAIKIIQKQNYFKKDGFL
jgi:hypothetical protein